MSSWEQIGRTWVVLADTPEQALTLVREDRRTDPAWQLEVGPSASTLATGDPRIVHRAVLPAA